MNLNEFIIKDTKPITFKDYFLNNVDKFYNGKSFAYAIDRLDQLLSES